MKNKLFLLIMAIAQNSFSCSYKFIAASAVASIGLGISTTLKRSADIDRYCEDFFANQSYQEPILDDALRGWIQEQFGLIGYTVIIKAEDIWISKKTYPYAKVVHSNQKAILTLNDVALNLLMNNQQSVFSVDTVKGIIMHEIGHIAYRHTLKKHKAFGVKIAFPLFSSLLTSSVVASSFVANGTLPKFGAGIIAFAGSYIIFGAGIVKQPFYCLF